MTDRKQDKKQPAPRALKDEALDQATGGRRTYEPLTITKRIDKSSP